MQLWACFLLRENDLCRLLPQILARITGRSFALDQGFLGPAKSWESPIIKADPLSLPNSFQRLSQPQSIIQLYPLQRSTVIQALCLSRCLQRGLFSMDTSRLIAFLAGFPPGNAHLSAGSAESNAAAAYRVTPRCPGGKRVTARTAAGAPPTLERDRDRERSLQPPASREPLRGGGCEPLSGGPKEMLRGRAEKDFPAGRSLIQRRSMAEVGGSPELQAPPLTWLSLQRG